MEYRHPHLVLGVDRGASAEEATLAFGRKAKRARRDLDAPFSLEDLTWALHQLEQPDDDDGRLVHLSVPADADAYELPVVTRPTVEPLERTTVPDGTAVAALAARSQDHEIVRAATRSAPWEPSTRPVPLLPALRLSSAQPPKSGSALVSVAVVVALVAIAVVAWRFGLLAPQEAARSISATDAAQSEAPPPPAPSEGGVEPAVSSRITTLDLPADVVPRSVDDRLYLADACANGPVDVFYAPSAQAAAVGTEATGSCFKVAPGLPTIVDSGTEFTAVFDSSGRLTGWSAIGDLRVAEGRAGWIAVKERCVVGLEHDDLLVVRDGPNAVAAPVNRIRPNSCGLSPVEDELEVGGWLPVFYLGTAGWSDARLLGGARDETPRVSAPTPTPEASPTDDHERKQAAAPWFSAPVTSGAAAPDLETAVAIMRSMGFEPEDVSNWSTPEFSVIIGAHSTTGPNGGDQAFFFADGTYLGRDFWETSHAITYVSRTKSTLTLRYSVFVPTDDDCCSSYRDDIEFLYDEVQQSVSTRAEPAPTEAGERFSRRGAGRLTGPSLPPAQK